MLRTLTLLFCILPGITSLTSQTPSKDKPVLSLSFSSDKELSSLHLSNQSEWIISKNGNGGKCLKQLGTNLAPDSTLSSMLLVKDIEAGSFILEADVMQTPARYGLVHLDIIFGYKSEKEFAFAQLASRANRFVHNLFLMKDGEWERILDKQDKGIDWGFEKWHSVRIERDTNKKKVTVWIDNNVIFESDDQRLMNGGMVGFGNSGDSFKLDNLKLWITQ